MDDHPSAMEESDLASSTCTSHVDQSNSTSSTEATPALPTEVCFAPSLLPDIPSSPHSACLPHHDSANLCSIEACPICQDGHAPVLEATEDDLPDPVLASSKNCDLPETIPDELLASVPDPTEHSDPPQVASTLQPPGASTADLPNVPDEALPDLLDRRQHCLGPECPLEKPQGHLRVIGPNLGRLPIFARADKSTQFLANIKDYNPDVVLSTDIGVFWKNLEAQDSWWERTAVGFPRHKVKFSYNVLEDLQQKVQWGGTAVMCLSTAHSRVYKQMGSDPTNLGRWTWARVQGRHGHFLRVASAYRPNKNTSEVGSVYQQHLRYFRAHNEN